MAIALNANVSPPFGLIVYRSTSSAICDRALTTAGILALLNG